MPPCRVIDTRLAGGRIANETIRSFEIASVTDYTAQGGAATNCNVGNVGAIGSVVINFSSPALAVPPPRTPGVKVSHSPIMEDDGKEIVRAPVLMSVVVTP